MGQGEEDLLLVFKSIQKKKFHGALIGTTKGRLFWRLWRLAFGDSESDIAQRV